MALARCTVHQPKVTSDKCGRRLAQEVTGPWQHPHLPACINSRYLGAAWRRGRQGIVPANPGASQFGHSLRQHCPQEPDHHIRHEPVFCSRSPPPQRQSTSQCFGDFESNFFLTTHDRFICMRRRTRHLHIDRLRPTQSFLADFSRLFPPSRPAPLTRRRPTSRFPSAWYSISQKDNSTT